MLYYIYYIIYIINFFYVSVYIYNIIVSLVAKPWTADQTVDCWSNI